jgi:transposase InsO family protein
MIWPLQDGPSLNGALVFFAHVGQETVSVPRPRASLVDHTAVDGHCIPSDYRRALVAVRIVYSLRGRGSRWDNAHAERSFTTIRIKDRRHFGFNTREADRDSARRWNCRYNAHRRYSTLGLVSPATFEA